MQIGGCQGLTRMKCGMTSYGGGWVSIWDNESILELDRVGLGQEHLSVLGAIELATFTFVTFTPVRKNKLLLKTCAGSLFPWEQKPSLLSGLPGPTGSVAPWLYPFLLPFFSYWAHWPPCMLWLHASHFPPFALAVPSAWRAPLPAPIKLPPHLCHFFAQICHASRRPVLPTLFSYISPKGPSLYSAPLYLLPSNELWTFSDWFWLWFALLLPASPLPAPRPLPPPPPLHCSSTKGFSLLLHSGFNLCWFFTKFPQNQITNNYMFKQIH